MVSWLQEMINIMSFGWVGGERGGVVIQGQLIISDADAAFVRVREELRVDPLPLVSTLILYHLSTL